MQHTSEIAAADAAPVENGVMPAEAITAQPLSPAVERAVKLSYAQSMLCAVYASTNGGMFLIGYALALGASDFQIGLLNTIPMLCVVVQLYAAILVERGASRRRMTLFGALLNVIGWIPIMLIPFLTHGAGQVIKVSLLIGLIALITVFGHLAGNARGSWVGDLIPAGYLGAFFGKIIMYGGIIGTILALGAGWFLDVLKESGAGAFAWLFAFGMLFGLLYAVLYAPQPDVKLQRHASGGRTRELIKETFANGALMAVMVYALLWSLQSIAGPFYLTYMLRDLHMPFFGVAIVNSVVSLTMLLSSPFWGRMVDRFGCRPALIACTAVLVPLPLIWLVMTSPLRVYLVIIPINMLVGFAVSGISVALNTLVYKVTPTAGRAMQFAIYSIIVTLAAAPMPAIGGMLPGWLGLLHLPADVRVTFYAAIPFVLAAAWAAHAIRENGACGARELVCALPRHLHRSDHLHNA